MTSLAKGVGKSSVKMGVSYLERPDFFKKDADSTLPSASAMRL
jgi:hypothetical protein